MSAKNQIKLRPIFYIPIIIIPLGLALFFTIYDSKRIDQLHHDYGRLEDNESVYGRITQIYTKKGACFVTLNTGKKIFIPTSRNYKTKKKYLDESLGIGDSLFKHKDTDTLFLSRDDIIEYFVIGELINNKQ